MSAMGSVSSAVLEYDTPKIVHIKNKKVGTLNRLVQVAIVLYIIVYVQCGEWPAVGGVAHMYVGRGVRGKGIRRWALCEECPCYVGRGVHSYM